MSTDETRDEELSIATITAAAQAGVTVFDTAHAYAPDPAQLGHNERLLAQALRRRGARARIVTKGGMTRAGGGWIPDGRAKAIRADCEASLMALDGLEIDLYLLHAPDPRTPWQTSVRALARLVEEGLVRRVGLSNVNRAQLEAACELAPIAAVQVGLSVVDDRAVRGGVLERCDQRGITVIAHSPLGGPRRAGRLARRPGVAEMARQKGVSAAELALAWLLGLSPTVVPIPGARRPETARSAAGAASLILDAEDRAAVAVAFGGSRPQPPARSTPTAETDLVIVMGIPGAGKSRLAKDYADRGYVRLNRDERGGSLRDLADALDEQLSSGVRRVVLDNTYLSRASRSYVTDAARSHGVSTRCLWLDTPLPQAQVNLIQRILERVGSLPGPEELRTLARREPDLLMPTAQMRALRELEAPSTDEGLASVERLPFSRAASSRLARGGVFIGARALDAPGWERLVDAADPSAPHLIFDWRPEAGAPDLSGAADRVADQVSGPVEIAVCPHPAGPPTCWCRPPLPGLLLAFARAHDLDITRATVIGASTAHRTMARTLGAHCVLVG